jgi:hypothetical protein
MVILCHLACPWHAHGAVGVDQPWISCCYNGGVGGGTVSGGYDGVKVEGTHDFFLLYPNVSTFSLPLLMQTSMMTAFFRMSPKEVTKSQCGKGEGVTAMTR